MEFMYFVFTRMPRDSYYRRFQSLLLRSCDVFGARINLLCLLIDRWIASKSDKETTDVPSFSDIQLAQ